MGARDDDLEVTRAMREALDGAVGAAARNALVRAALRSSGRSHVPLDVEGALVFVRGPLRAAIVRSLGTAFGDALIEEIADQMARPASRSAERRASRSTPPKRPSRAPTPARSARTPPGRSLTPRGTAAPLRRPPSRDDTRTPAVAPSLGNAVKAFASPASGPITIPPGARRRVPVVLLVSKNERLRQELGEALDLQASLVPVDSVFALVGHLEAAQGLSVLVIVDCQAPSIRPTAIAALADELGDQQVLLYRTTPGTEQALLRVSAECARFVCCEAGEAPRELARRCIELVS